MRDDYEFGFSDRQLRTIAAIAAIPHLQYAILADKWSLVRKMLKGAHEKYVKVSNEELDELKKQLRHPSFTIRDFYEDLREFVFE